MDSLPVTTRPLCEPDMSVPLRTIVSVGPGGQSARSTYARCSRCGRHFVPDTTYPARCNGPLRTP